MSRNNPFQVLLSLCCHYGECHGWCEPSPHRPPGVRGPLGSGYILVDQPFPPPRPLHPNVGGSRPIAPLCWSPFGVEEWGGLGLYTLYTIYYILYSVYISQLEDTLKNTSSLPCLGFKPGISSYGRRKLYFCARLRLPLAAPSREYFLLLSILHESIEYRACEISAVDIVHTISSYD